MLQVPGDTSCLADVPHIADLFSRVDEMLDEQQHFSDAVERQLCPHLQSDTLPPAELAEVAAVLLSHCLIACSLIA